MTQAQTSTSDLYGQFFGSVEGSSKGQLIINIDRIRAGRKGSIMFYDNGQGFPLVANLLVSETSHNTFEGVFDQVIGFGASGELVYPHQTSESYLSSSGKIKFTRQFGGGIAGSWSAEHNEEGTFTAKNISEPALNSVCDPVKEVITWDQFKQLIDDERRYPEGMYYRGHDSSEHRLRTKFHRQGCWDIYRYLREALPKVMEDLSIYSGRHFDNHNPVDTAPALFLAQHHGFPTPLLDWTTSPYIAAYFAFRPYGGPHPTTDSVRVYAFDVQRWVRDFHLLTNGPFIKPNVMITPSSVSMTGNARALRQRGQTVYSNVGCISEMIRLLTKPDTKPYVEYFDIAFKEQDKALRYLQRVGIDETSLFPDLDHACEVLTYEYFKKN